MGCYTQSGSTKLRGTSDFPNIDFVGPFGINSPRFISKLFK